MLKICQNRSPFKTLTLLNKLGQLCKTRLCEALFGLKRAKVKLLLFTLDKCIKGRFAKVVCQDFTE